MKLSWHIIWKDIRSERWTLLFLTALVLGQTWLGLAAFHHDDVERVWVDAVRMVNLVLVAMQAVTGYLLVVRLVQADALAGTRMFWTTRPISAERLLKAKAGGALLLGGLLPVLLKAPWWLYCGFGASDLGWAALEALGWQLLLIGPAFLIAALTDDFGRAVMWGLMLLAGLLAGVISLQDKLSTRGGPFLAFLADDYTRPGGLLFTRVWLCALVLIMGSIAVAVHQFLTRRFYRSLVFAGLVVVLILRTGRAWPVDCTILLAQINEPEPMPRVAESALDRVELTQGPALIQTPEHPVEGSATWIQQGVELRGVPEGLMPNGATLQQSWIWPDDRTSAVGRMFYLGHRSDWHQRKALGMPASSGDAETARWLEARYAERRAKGLPVWPGYQYWLPQTEEGFRLVGRTLLPDPLVARIRRQAPAAQAQIDVKLVGLQMLFEQPLKPGAVWSSRSSAFRLGSWQDYRGRNVVNTQMLTARPGVRENGLWSADTMERAAVRGGNREWEWIPLNRHNNTIGSSHRSSHTDKSGWVVIGGVFMQWNTLAVYSSQVIRDGKWVQSDPDWPQHTTLAVMIPIQAGRLIRELRTEKYELQPAGLEEPKADADASEPPREDPVDRGWAGHARSQ